MLETFINFAALFSVYLFGCLTTRKQTERQMERLEQERDDLEMELLSERTATRLYKQRMAEYIDVLLKKLKAKR